MDPAAAGHFTTMQVRDGRVQGRELHFIRLVTASRELYGSGPAKSEVGKRFREALLAAGHAGDFTLKMRVLPPRPGYRGDDVPPGHHDPAFRIEVDIEPPRQPPASPLRVRTHAGLRSCPGVKHLALDYQLTARRQARDSGFDDAVLLAPDGRISEGTFWNIVFWDGSAVVWPDAPALAGVTQWLLRAALDQAGLPQRREAVDMGSLGGLRTAFALNSTGIADITAIDDHVFAADAGAGATLRQLLAGVPWDRS